MFKYRHTEQLSLVRAYLIFFIVGMFSSFRLQPLLQVFPVRRGIINKPLLLHLVGCLYYLYQWYTVKQVSDNEIYLFIKYIKSVLWRGAQRLSYIEDARCLKVKHAFHRVQSCCEFPRRSLSNILKSAAQLIGCRDSNNANVILQLCINVLELFWIVRIFTVCQSFKK